MKNTAINSLKYTGIVTLSQYIESKKVKIAQVYNAGGYSLFNFLADCLLGDFDIAKINRPTKIMLLEKIEEKDAQGNLLSVRYESRSGFIYLLNKPEKVYSTTKGTVTYSFIVARDILQGSSFSSIGLYTNATEESDYENYAAVCDITNIEAINARTLSASSALVVDWELNISNK